jgi:hypothetical protein
LKENLLLCNTSLINGNLFEGNNAEIQGGAIAYSSSGPTDLDNSTIYTDNTAGMHSPTISSFASKLIIEYDSELTTLTPTANQSFDHLGYQ